MNDNFKEKIEAAEQRISELNPLINYWRKQNDLKRESKDSRKV